MTKDERLTKRTCKLIGEGKVIFLRQKKGNWYLHCWTNIAGGPDKVSWGSRQTALEIFNLKWAFALAPLYKCVVVAYDPRHNTEEILKPNAPC